MLHQCRVKAASFCLQCFQSYLGRLRRKSSLTIMLAETVPEGSVGVLIVESI